MAHTGIPAGRLAPLPGRHRAARGPALLHQRGRFFSALVRPLVWLFIFAAGFRFVLGVSIIPPYETYVLYEVYIVAGPGRRWSCCSRACSRSLSMVYDREMGSMRALLISPLPRWWLLFCKLLAGVAGLGRCRSMSSCSIAWFWEVEPPLIGYLTVLPALILAGMMLGALGLLLSSGIRQLENFAGVMNFVIFPMFFASSALYPLWRVQESSLPLWDVCQANPFTQAVELIRFALYGQFDPVSCAAVTVALLVFGGAAVLGYDPQRGMLARRAAA